MIAHLDCSSGISGDKFLGALIDAGFASDQLRSAVAPLGIAPESLLVERVTSAGIAAVSVRLRDAPAAKPAAVGHVAAGPAAAGPAAHAPLRCLADIRGVVASAGLCERVAARALQVFELLAEAEAQVHGTSVDEVHFHEIGALDTILDVVGVALGLDALGIDELIATPPAVGGGTVQTAHGRLPVPAPATVQLLLGLPVVTGPTAADGAPAGELTTPTGAALVRSLATGFGPLPSMVATTVGYGAGTRDVGFPNVTRVVVGERTAGVPAPSSGDVGRLALETIAVLETNIDHLSPEQLAFCAEELLAEGALDVWQTPIVMKKGRAAVALSLMCTPGDAERLVVRTHELTGTLGVRRRDVERTVVAREERTFDTRHGAVRVKVARVDGQTQARAEHDDVARIARDTGRSVRHIADELATDIAAALCLE